MIDLRFHGPFPFCGGGGRTVFDVEDVELAGIYVFSIKADDGYLVSYVGQTRRSFRQRLKEHFIHWMGGNYQVFDPIAYRREEKRLIWPGLWRKGARDQMNSFWKRYVELAPRIQELLALQEIFLAPLEHDSRILTRIEGALFEVLSQGEPRIAGFLDEGIRYSIRKESEPPLNVRVGASMLLGIPRQLIA